MLNQELKSLSSHKNRIAIVVSTLFIFVAAYLTFHGLASLTWPQIIPFATKESFLTYVVLLVFLTTLIGFCSAVLKYSPISVGIVFAFILALLCGQIWSLLIVFLFVVSSILFGDILMNLLKFSFQKGEFLIKFLIGSGFYGTMVGLIAHLPINYPGLYSIILLLPIFISRVDLMKYSKEVLNKFCEKQPKDSKFDWVGILISAVALIYFIVALMPEKGHDALAMHLFIPAQLASNHVWNFDVNTYVWAVMPTLGDWIFSVVYMLSGESSARILNLVFIFLGGRLVYLLALWAGASITGSMWATLIFISTPLTFAEASTLYIESVWSTFLVAAMMLLLRSKSSSLSFNTFLIIGALFFGYAVASKSTTLPLLPLIFIFLLIYNKSALRTTPRWIWGLSLCIFLAFGLIPHIRAFWITGNPLFPFYNAIFKSPSYLLENFQANHFGRGINWDDLYRITFDSSKFLEATSGASGFQWILLLIPCLIFLLLTSQRRPLLLSLIGIAMVLVIFQFTAYLRYIFPATFFLSALIGVVIGGLFSSQVNKIFRLTWIIAVNFVVFLNLLFLTSGSFYRDFGVLAIFDNSFRSAYLNANIPIRTAVEIVNQLNTDKSPVAFFSHPLAAGLKADALYPNWYNYKFRDDISSASNLEAMAKVLLDRKVNWVVLDSSWVFGEEKKAVIFKITEEVSSLGSISIRRIKQEYRFPTELLLNPNFSSISGWNLDPNINYDARSQTMIVSVNALASQSFLVKPNQSYLNTVMSRCHKEKTQGRIQINWLNKNNEFLGASIKVFDCTSAWSEQSMEIISPKDATSAIAYVAGHNLIPIEFSKNSVKN
jgi:hypothetical protein